MKKKFKYLQQNSPLTLAQGLAEYTAGYIHLNNNNGDTEESNWFRMHDITHVIFGTIPFQIRGETMNDLWTLFGSDMTLKRYLKFFKFIDYNVVMNSYLKQYKSKWRIYLKTFAQIPIALFTIYRALKMKKKWKWHEPDAYLNHPLAEIREEFGIKVIKP